MNIKKQTNNGFNYIIIKVFHIAYYLYIERNNNNIK